MPILLFSPTGRLRASLTSREQAAGMTAPGDVLTVCECETIAHADLDTAASCAGLVMLVRFGAAGPSVERLR